MKSRISKILLSFAILALAWTNPLFAYLEPAPGHFSLQGEFLYLHPSIDDTYFVIDQKGPASSTPGFIPAILISDLHTRVIDNPLGWHPAYRVVGIYSFCDGCHDIFVDWSSLNFSEQRCVNGTNLLALGNIITAPISAPGAIVTAAVTEANSKIHITYHSADLLFGQYLTFDCCPIDFIGRVGVQYAYIHEKEELNYLLEQVNTDPASTFSINDPAESKNHFWGVGPRIGFDFNYPFCSLCYCDALSFTGRIGGSLLVSETRSTRTKMAPIITPPSPLESQILRTKEDQTWRIVPTWDMRLGLNYLSNICCFPLALEVGYEFTSYIRALSKIKEPTSQQQPGSADTYNQYINFDIHGPYVNLGFSY